MTLARWKLTPEDHRSILKIGGGEDHVINIWKYHIAPSLFVHWKHQFLSEGIQGRRDRYVRI